VLIAAHRTGHPWLPGDHITDELLAHLCMRLHGLPTLAGLARRFIGDVQQRAARRRLCRVLLTCMLLCSRRGCARRHSCHHCPSVCAGTLSVDTLGSVAEPADAARVAARRARLRVMRPSVSILEGTYYCRSTLVEARLRPQSAPQALRFC